MIYHSEEDYMNIKEKILVKADKIADEHTQRVLFDLDLESSEALSRIGGMGITMEILKYINGIKANWYSFQGIRDRTIFIFLYPLSVSFCYAFNDVKRIINYVFSFGRR